MTVKRWPPVRLFEGRPVNSALIVQVRKACYKLAETQAPDGKRALRDVADGLWPSPESARSSGAETALVGAESALIPAEEP
jgi:hypothetical protein